MKKVKDKEPHDKAVVVMIMKVCWSAHVSNRVMFTFGKDDAMSTAKATLVPMHCSAQMGRAFIRPSRASWGAR